MNVFAFYFPFQKNGLCPAASQPSLVDPEGRVVISSKTAVNGVSSVLYGDAVAQSVETPGEEVSGSIPAVAARSLLVGSVSV